MVGGLEDTLAGIYASNKYLSNVPDSAIIYMTNSTGHPTLVGLRFGYGLIFYSGQPLEYNFDRRDEYSMGFLLPRILHFMLGKPWEESCKFPAEKYCPELVSARATAIPAIFINTYYRKGCRDKTFLKFRPGTD
jgi:hypothetical protein